MGTGEEEGQGQRWGEEEGGTVSSSVRRSSEPCQVLEQPQGLLLQPAGRSPAKHWRVALSYKPEPVQLLPWVHEISSTLLSAL